MKNPLDKYIELQSFVKKEATDIYNKLGTKYGVAENPYHVHNGVDSPQLNPSNFLGWPVFQVTDATVAPTDTPQNGTFRFYVDTVPNYTLWAYLAVNNGGYSSSWQSIGGGGGSSLTIQTNGTPNGSQTLLNLVEGTNINLTDNGSGSVTIDASGGGGSSIGVLLATVFETINRFVQNITSGGTVSLDNQGALLDTSTTISSAIKLGWSIVSSPITGSPTFSIFVSPQSNASNYTSFFGIGNPTVNGAGIDFTSDHCGFKIVRTGSGTVNVSATQGDGGTESATIVSTGIGDYEFIVKINGSSSVDYYFRKDGGSLVGPTNISTNMPSVASNMSFAVSNIGVAVRTQLHIGSASYQR